MFFGCYFSSGIIFRCHYLNTAHTHKHNIIKALKADDSLAVLCLRHWIQVASEQDSSLKKILFVECFGAIPIPSPWAPIKLTCFYSYEILSETTTKTLSKLNSICMQIYQIGLSKKKRTVISRESSKVPFFVELNLKMKVHETRKTISFFCRNSENLSFWENLAAIVWTNKWIRVQTFFFVFLGIHKQMESQCKWSRVFSSNQKRCANISFINCWYKSCAFIWYISDSGAFCCIHLW